MRVFELAKKLSLSTKELLLIIRKLEMEITGNFSKLSHEAILQIEKEIQKNSLGSEKDRNIMKNRQSEGGTKKWCPYCRSITVCKAVNPSQLGAKSGQRWQYTQHQDIRWFRRGLICQDCGHEWFSAEVEEKFLKELTELRDALGDIKQNAEKYLDESENASNALKGLSSSLNVLKALKIYKEQE